jgi:uncharacterized protein YigA (DUF484 family)
VKTSFDEKLEILDTVDVHMRLKKAVPLVDRQIEALKQASRAASNSLARISEKEKERDTSAKAKVDTKLNSLLLLLCATQYNMILQCICDLAGTNSNCHTAKKST